MAGLKEDFPRPARRVSPPAGALGLAIGLVRALHVGDELAVLLPDMWRCGGAGPLFAQCVAAMKSTAAILSRSRKVLADETTNMVVSIGKDFATIRDHRNGGKAAERTALSI